MYYSGADNIQYCGLEADSGFGDSSQKRFFMNADKKHCEEFTFKGKGGNRNNFDSKAKCEKACSAFLPRTRTSSCTSYSNTPLIAPFLCYLHVSFAGKPQAIWPLTDKFTNPVQDLTGNGHDGKIHSMSPGFFTFPGSETRAYRFRGSKDSYIEVTL